MRLSLIKRTVAEFLGTAGLLIAIVASALLVVQYEPQLSLLALLVHAMAVGFALFALIAIFSPIADAHFNPALSVVMVFRRSLPFYELPFYLVAQCAGAAVGVLLAHMMFTTFVSFETTHLLSISGIDRSSNAVLIAEGVFTYLFMLVLVSTIQNNPSRTALAAGLFVSAAIISSPSAGFMNPAVTFGRIFTSSMAGINPDSSVSVCCRAAVCCHHGGWHHRLDDIRTEKRNILNPVTSLSWLTLVLSVAVLMVLAAGLVVMARGGEVSRAYSQKFMRWRVALQLAAIIAFAVHMMMTSW